ncbi:MAG TPA: ABC transporter permease, partial [Candidatus Solibacter sp.]|nr:ABC transporter permease [Candidatus Solibacter sp.]
RSEFGDDMEEAFREQRAETGRRGGSLGLWRMWWATITDILRMAPREHASVLAQDTRFALRMMLKNRGYTIAAILILGLGIGANSAIFSVVNSVLLRPLPYASGERLLVLHQSRSRHNTPMGFSVAELNDYRQRSHTMDSIVEYHGMTFMLYGGKEPYSVRTGVVSAGYFDFLGVRPILGRTFVASDEGPGAQPVLILSYETWKRQEHGDPNIIGKKYEMNDKPHIVIGVLPPIPQYPDENDAYMTTSACPFRSRPATIERRGARMMQAFGRLKPGATFEQAREDVRAISAQMAKEHPDSYPETLGFSATPTELRDQLTREARPLLWTLLAAAGFVLLIACANVANLILARMAQRDRELAIRWAMGAGAGRLLRQLLTESLILALIAAAVGLAFARSSIALLIGFTTQLTPRAREISLDVWVLGFAIACATFTSLVCGSLAALYSRNGLSRSQSAQRSRVRNVLIAAQVAFSYVLLIGAGLMVRSMVQLQRVDPGFVAQHTFAVMYDRDFTKYRGGDAQRAADRRVLERVQEVPAVLTSAISSDYPMNPGDRMNMRGAIRPFGDARPDGELIQVPVQRFVSSGYFRTLGIRLIDGRFLQDADNEKAESVVVLNRSLSDRLWGNLNPIGRKVSFGGDEWHTVVGIVADVKEFGPSHAAPAQAYFSILQNPMARCLVVRAAGDPAAAILGVRRAVMGANPGTAIIQINTLEEARDESVRPPRTVTRMFGLFSGLALLISVAGIGSMLMLWVRQRIREIGIRMALGARPGDIVSSVMRQGMARAVIGFILGIGGALVLTRFLKTLLFEVTPTDAETYAAVSVVLLSATLVGCWIPARRAARVDPQTALRSE